MPGSPEGRIVGHYGERLRMEELWFLLLGDQACYCLDSQSRFGDGMGLVPEWAVPVQPSAEVLREAVWKEKPGL